MQKILLYTCFVLICSVQVIAQDTLRGFLNSDLQIVDDPARASFSVDIISKNDLWEAIIYYPKGNLAGTGTFKTKKLETRHGKFTAYYSATGRKMYEAFYDEGFVKGLWQSWHENGKKKDSGLLDDAKKTGYWVTWYPNGNKATEGAYRDYSTMNIPETIMKRGSKLENRTQRSAYLQYLPDEKTGVWQGWYENGKQKDYTSYGNEGKQDGVAKTWYENGNMESAGVYSNGKITGRWDWFHQNGAKATIEEYRNGKVAGLQCFDTLNNFTGEMCSVSRLAIYPGGPVAFKQFVEKNQEYPNVPGKPEGYVEAKLKIDTAGKPYMAEVLRTNHPYFVREANRLIYRMPAWEPAVAHNRKVDSEMTVWFSFSPKKKK